MRLLAVVALLIVIGSPTYGSAGKSDLDQIRQVIERQLTALRRGRGAVAYNLASPEIRRQFTSVASFMRMMKASYRPLLNHRRFTLMDLQATSTGFAHGVRLVDAAGMAWTALYTVEKQADGSWSISGCRLERGPT